MKKILTLSAAAMAIVFTACDDVNENDRKIPLEIQETEKVILAEEFTGANCPNCPTGASTLASLHETYGKSLIPVSLYPDKLENLTSPKNVDLRTKEASEIFAAYNQENILPSVMFNRTRIDGKVLQATKPEVWGATVYDLFESSKGQYSPCDIELSGSYDEASRTLSVNYLATFKHLVSQEVAFQVYVLEDGIISRQAGPNGLLPRYENNHVLRKALEGTWGKSYGANHTPGTTIEGSVTYTLSEEGKWTADAPKLSPVSKMENVSLVGFVCNVGGDREVLHAVQLPKLTIIKQPETEE